MNIKLTNTNTKTKSIINKEINIQQKTPSNTKNKFIANFINNVIDFIQINNIEIDKNKLINYQYGLIYFKNFFYEILYEMFDKQFIDEDDYKEIYNETTEFDILLIYSSEGFKKFTNTVPPSIILYRPN